MPPFWNRPRISPDFIAVPNEPSAAQRSGEALICEARILELDERILGYQHAGLSVMVDRLLDMRNAIRPPRPAEVPVIPGRPS